MKTKGILFLSGLLIVCVVSIGAKIFYESRITLEMNQRNQLIAICEEAGYDITRENLTLLRDSYFSPYLTWQWQVRFPDEPDLCYVFQQQKSGKYVLVDLLGTGTPQKDFTPSSGYGGALFEGAASQ